VTGPVVFVSDPPWRFGDRLPGPGRGASKQYSCMDVHGIVEIMEPICRDARSFDAVLFLWRVAAMQEEALRVAESLAFTVKTELVWQKLTKTGKPHFGMGHYVRASHETCLVCVRGKARPAIHTQRSVFSAPVGRHSEKPGAFYRIVEEMYPDSRRVEFFARTVRLGWEQLGDQLGEAV
jgi:N6-adenosine-specific RNA methylase IME4